MLTKQVETAASTTERAPAQGRFAGRMHREYRYYKALLADPRTPTTAKWLIGGGVGYLLLPFDLIPDFIPIIGKVDDMLIAPALIGLGMKLVPEQVKDEDRSRSRRIRVLYDDDSMGPVLFESEALPGPFGIRIGSSGRDPEIQGPVLFPLLDLMYEYGLVVLADKTPSADRVDGYTLHTATIEESGLCTAQMQLDVNFRPLPLIAAVMYCKADSGSNETFVDTDAAYRALPPKLKKQVEGAHLRWSPCSEMRLDAILNSDDRSSCTHSAAHAVSGAQFINLLLSEDCRILDYSDACAGQLLADLRGHVRQDTLCYTHRSKVGELVTWNPRHVLHIPPDDSTNTPKYVYPRHLTGTTLGR